MMLSSLTKAQIEGDLEGVIQGVQKIIDDHVKTVSREVRSFINNERINNFTIRTNLAQQEKKLHFLEEKYKEETEKNAGLIMDLYQKIEKLSVNVKTEAQFLNGMLLNAAKNGQQNKIKLVLQLGADLTAKDEYGRTALHFSVLNGHKEVSEYILNEEKRLLLLADNTNYTPIQLLVSAKNDATDLKKMEILNFLYKKSNLIAFFNEEQGEFNKVYDAATPEIRLLLANKQLWELTKSNQLEGVRDAINKGADVNQKTKNGETALHRAIAINSITIAKLLIDMDADPAICNANNKTALDIAKEQKNEAMMKVVATAFLIFAAQRSLDKGIKAALAAGADLVGVDNHGQTALHKAVLQGNKETIKFLLKKHAEAGYGIQIKDNAGNTPYQLAIKSKTTVNTHSENIDLEIYLLEKFGSYKRELKLQAKHTSLSNSTLGFISSNNKNNNEKGGDANENQQEEGKSYNTLTSSLSS